MVESNPKHFAFAEMVKTTTGLENVPSWEAIENLRELGLFLDKIREDLGGIAIRVNCGFRSESVNKAVGGVATSAHLKGMAADICAWNGKESTNRELYAVLSKKIGSIDQLISYHKTAGDFKSPIRFIHVGLAAKPRGQVLCK